MPDPALFLPSQKSQIYTWDGRQSDRWVKLDLKTELPRDTLLSVEIVHELKGEVRGGSAHVSWPCPLGTGAQLSLAFLPS